jgi:hypothetical protein
MWPGWRWRKLQPVRVNCSQQLALHVGIRLVVHVRLTFSIRLVVHVCLTFGIHFAFSISIGWRCCAQRIRLS